MSHWEEFLEINLNQKTQELYISGCYNAVLKEPVQINYKKASSVIDQAWIQY